MVRTGLVFASIACSTVAFAHQQPGRAIPVPGSAQPAGVQPGGLPIAGGVQPAPLDPKLVGHLQAWEKRMKEIGNVVCEVDKVEKDNILKREMKRTGKIYCAKPNFAWMRLDRAKDMERDDNDFTTWICDGRMIYQYAGRQKELTEFRLTNPAGGIEGNLLLEFISGSMSADQAMQRFDLKLLTEDANYVYLEVKPKFVRDREDFQTLTLVFFGPNIKAELQHIRYLPAMVRMTKNDNKEEEVWTFRTPQVNVQGLTAETFKKQPVPQGWRTVQAGGTSAGPISPIMPKVARP